ncbi:MAG: GNAT family N-acetyltransferase [Erysipelotrichaceae bacterium]|nr:GNAT family N-acetyltransferase [Erysipelotrichaceae bacterium]
MIRQAEKKDLSRIGEILVFVKRIKFRPIFQDDEYSFNELQVLSVVEKYKKPEILNHIWVYDDGIVKGLVHIEGKEIVELYVDCFFQNRKIGSTLIEFALGQGCSYLWVIEKNTDAIRFYERHGFYLTEEKKYEEGTTEFLVKMSTQKEKS